MRLNRLGRAALGTGNGTVSVDGVALVEQAGGVCWLDDDTLIYQVMGPPCCTLETYHVPTNTRTQVAPRGANAIIAGGGRWAAWLGGYGVFGSVGHLPQAGVVDASRDGTLAIKPDYHGQGGLRLYAPDGGVRETDAAWGAGLCVSRPYEAYWACGGPIVALFGDAPAQPPVKCWSPRVADDWIVAWCDEWGLIAWDASLTGYVVTREVAYNHDAVILPDGRLRVAWSAQPGERPENLRVTDFDLSQPRVDFRQRPVEAIPVPQPGETPRLGQRWIGVYKDAGLTLPGNCCFGAVPDTLVRRRDGALIATMDPASDSRDWVTPAGTKWVGLYCYVDWQYQGSIAEAQRACRELCEAQLASVPADQPVILLCQMFGRNFLWTNEASMAGLMKVYPEVASEHPNVKALLYFSGPDRRDGTGDHPGLIPWYQAACDAVEGEPQIDRERIVITDPPPVVVPLPEADPSQPHAVPRPAPVQAPKSGSCKWAILAAAAAPIAALFVKLFKRGK